MLPRYRDPTIWVSLGARGYRTSQCDKDTVLTLTMHTLSLLADLGKKIIHDCDRRNRLCVASNVPGSDQSRRPFARISDNVTLEDFHHSF
jgi:hypothetical protein